MLVFRSTVIDKPVVEIWQVLRHFDGVKHWHPAVADCHIEGRLSATEVGCIRHIVLKNGGVIRETLLALDDSGHAFAYDIIESPLPVQNYVAVQRFMPITDGERTYALWEVRFDTEPANEAEMERLVGEEIFMGGFRGLQAYVAG